MIVEDRDSTPLPEHLAHVFRELNDLPSQPSQILNRRCPNSIFVPLRACSKVISTPASISGPRLTGGG